MSALLSQSDMARSYERLVNESYAAGGRKTKAFVEFQRAFGKDSISFLLRELGSRPTLAAIRMLQNVTGENPVPDNISDNVGEAAKAWIKWGLRNKGRV